LPVPLFLDVSTVTVANTPCGVAKEA
jgi:hypothetical protein